MKHKLPSDITRQRKKTKLRAIKTDSHEGDLSQKPVQNFQSRYGNQAIAGLMQRKLKGEPNDHWLLKFYQTIAKDEQTMDIYKHWIEGSGKLLNLSSDAWRQYMMNNQSLLDQLVPQVVEDALTRMSWLQLAFGHKGTTHLTGPVYRRFHIELKENDYRTGYALLHGSNEDVGDFEIKGTFDVFKNTPIQGFSVNYDLELVFNDIVDPLKGHALDQLFSFLSHTESFDELLLLMVEFYQSDEPSTVLKQYVKKGVKPKSYVLRVKWHECAKVNISGATIWGRLGDYTFPPTD